MNILQTAFALKKIPKAQKDTNDLTVVLYFWDLGSMSLTFYIQFFTHSDSKSVKKTDKLSIFFMLSGSMSVKAVLKR